MKKPIAFLAAILSLVPLGQPLFIKTSFLVSSFAMMLTLPEKVEAESALSFNQKGIKAWEQGDHYLAISYYNKAINLEPNEPTWYYNRGLSKYQISDYKGAITDYDKATKLDPNYTDAFENRGLARNKIGDYYGAISDYIKAIKLNPKDGDIYFNRGNSLE